MKSTIKPLLLFLFLISLLLASCFSSWDGDEETAEFTITLGGSGRAVTYPPASPADTALLKFTISFAPTGGGVVTDFTFNGNESRSGRIAPGIYNVSVTITELSGGALYAQGFANSNPVTIIAGINTSIPVTVYAPGTPVALVGSQSGALTEGVAGSVTFPVTTTNIANGTYTATLGNAPTGVSVSGSVAISAGSGTLTLAGNTSTVAGTYSTLTLTISGATSTAFTLSIASSTSPGTGTTTDPFKVYDDTTLRRVGTETASGGWTLDAHYLQTASFTVSAANWAPIGDGSVPFEGSYDGGNFTITGLTLTMPSNPGPGVYFQGLFGFVDGSSGLTRAGLIENINLVNVTITGGDSTGSTGYQQIGGVVGWNEGTVSYCTVSGSSNIGGDSFGVNTWYSDVGGVVGHNHYGIVDHCSVSNTCTITSVSNAGSVVGVNDNGTISYCSGAGAVDSDFSVGGVVGYNFHGIVEYCSSTAVVTGASRIGGLAGYNYGSSGIIKDSYATGLVTGADSAGGLVGANSFFSTIQDCYATGDVVFDPAYSYSDNMGGLVGINQDDSVILRCYATGDVDGNITDPNTRNTGGLVGQNYRSDIQNCRATGNVIGFRQVGGLVGLNDSDTSGYSIERCYAAGDVTGVDYIGGLVGVNIQIVQNCYATGDVTGDLFYNSVSGGVVGENSSGEVYNCYATGHIKGSSETGGVVGYNNGGGLVQDCVALNSRITVEDYSGTPGTSTLGRVAGRNDGGCVLNTNYGLTGMPITDNGSNYSPANVPNGLDGGNVATANQTWWGLATWTGGAWSGSVWTWSVNGASNPPTLLSVP